MAAAEVHVGDVGTILRLTVQDQATGVVDISSATTLEIKLKKPDGTVLTKTAVLTSGGVDGKMEYVTLVADIDKVGVWEIQGHIVLATGEWHTESVSFCVASVLT